MNKLDSILSACLDRISKLSPNEMARQRELINEMPPNSFYTPPEDLELILPSKELRKTYEMHDKQFTNVQCNETYYFSDAPATQIDDAYELFINSSDTSFCSIQESYITLSVA